MYIFTGTAVNAALIVAGSIAGLLLKRIQSFQRIGERICQGFGLLVIVMGVQAVSLSRPVYFLVCLVLGTAIGEAVDLDGKFRRFGEFLRRKTAKGSGSSPDDVHYANGEAAGFIEASLLFCIGSMTFLGALQSGMEHEHSIYITKGILDGISSFSLSMVYGASVAFSALVVLLYQGLLTLVASALVPVLSEGTIAMCVSVGSLSLIAIGLNMLKLSKLKVANFLPAMFLPMLWQALQLLIER